MRIVLFAMAFIVASSYTFANEEATKNDFVSINDLVITNHNEINLNVISETDNLVLEKSCTLKSGSQVISNGEVVYEEVNTFHIDGYSCEEFFALLSLIMSAV